MFERLFCLNKRGGFQGKEKVNRKERRELTRSIFGKSLTKNEMDVLMGALSSSAGSITAGDLLAGSKTEVIDAGAPAEVKKIKNGDKVKINVDGIIENLGPVYWMMRKDYREFIEGNRDTVFTAKHVKDGNDTLITFEEDSKFYFIENDIILVE
ncbi:MAG: hypothetical protein Q4A54_08720 [Parabacteroides sp.]|nr:hypothetical protein [Parabacteroides sp.]